MPEDVSPVEADRIRKSPEYQNAKKHLADPEWRLDNLYWIRDSDGREIKFVRNATQRAYCKEAWCRDAIPKARKLGFCHAPHMRVLTADLRWIAIDDISVGQEIVAVDELLPGGKGKQRKMRLGRVEAKHDVYAPAFRIRLDSGVELVATGQHRYLTKKRITGNRRQIRGQYVPETIWRAVNDMHIGDRIRYITQPWDEPDYEDGWLGGMLDGEGSLRQKPAGGFEITISQTPGPVLERARKYLTERGYSFGVGVDSRTYENAFGKRSKPLNKLLIYRMNEAFRLIGQTRPTRFLERQWWKDRDLPGKKSGKAWSEIVSIEALPPQRMVDIQTSTKTFICEGVVSHNSTLIAILITDECIFHSGTIAGIVDRTLDDACDKLSMVRFAYDHLPADIREVVPLVTRNEKELKWANGSAATAGTTYRGGTPRLLHVSEYGKTSVDSPDTAREIKTGAIQAVPLTGRIWVESTSHGIGGEFKDMVARARAMADQKMPLTQRDFKMHFYGWWMKPEYRLPNNLVVVPHYLRDYFAEQKSKYGIKLDADQQAWYAKTYEELGPDDIKQEFPTNVDELFYSAIEGAYFRAEINRARQDNRIGDMVPFDPTRRVNTAWDIGEDMTAIWFHQTDGVRHRLIDYYEEEGGSLQTAVGVLDGKARERGFVYDKHYGPHDLDYRDWAVGAQSRYKTALDLGIKFTVVPRIAVKDDSIEAARRMLGLCWFDAEHCGHGVERLENYRKKWNKQIGVFIREPVHDLACHGADAFQQLAMGLVPERPREQRHRPQQERRASQWAS